jgi:uncharacterized protein (DUF1778 family)
MSASPASLRSARLGVRATPEQETVLRRAAEVAHKSLTDVNAFVGAPAAPRIAPTAGF